MKWSVLLSMTVLAVAVMADSGIHKWTDEDGNVHYSDLPPSQSSESEVIETLPGPSEDEIERAQDKLKGLLAEQEKIRRMREQRGADKLRRDSPAISPGNLVPGPTNASKGLQMDTLDRLFLYERVFRPECRDPRVVDTKVTEPLSEKRYVSGVLMKGSKWVEQWSLDSCGVIVTYRIEYVADGRGGTYFGTRLPPKLQ